MLGHLSKENNFPELAYKSVLEELEYAGYSNDDIIIDVASRTQITTINNTSISKKVINL